MLKQLTLFWLLIFCFSSVIAQDFNPLKDEVAFRKLFAEKSQEFITLKSDFVQEKSIYLLENHIISNGSFQYKREGKLRMEYFKPYSYLFVLNNDKVMIKNNQKQTNINANSNKLFKLISQITVDCINGNILSSKQFKTSILESSSSYKITLIPKMKELNSLLSEIIILISKKDYTVETIEMKEVSNDFTLMTFSNKEINKPIGDEAFSVR